MRVHVAAVGRLMFVGCAAGLGLMEVDVAGRRPRIVQAHVQAVQQMMLAGHAEVISV